MTTSEYPFASRWIDLAAGRMHYVDEGRGAPMLFVHGTPTWSFEFRHLLKAFAPTARVIAPDHLGFGLSSRPQAFAYTPEAHAANLLEFVDRLDLRNVTLVVHDFGGPIGLPLALERPDRIARVVVINSWMWPFDDDAMMTKRARIAGGRVGRFLYKYANFSLRVLMPSAYGNKRHLTPEIHREYLRIFEDRGARVQVLHTLAASLLGSRNHYAGLERRASELASKPVLVIWGMKDSAFQPYMLDRWRSLIPSARVVTVPDAGHWPHEEAPAAVVEAITSFAADNPRHEVPSSRASDSRNHQSIAVLAGLAALPWYPKAIVAIVAALFLALLVSRPLRRWAMTVDPRRLMAFHLVRFVGFYFLYLYSQRELPYEFAVYGGAGDIIVATLAAALLVRPPSRFALAAWNLLGFVDILGVAVTAARSELLAPGSMHQLGQFPLILLPTFIVPVIIVTHVVMLIRAARRQ